MNRMAVSDTIRVSSSIYENSRSGIATIGGEDAPEVLQRVILRERLALTAPPRPRGYQKLFALEKTATDDRRRPGRRGGHLRRSSLALMRTGPRRLRMHSQHMRAEPRWLFARLTMRSTGSR